MEILKDHLLETVRHFYVFVTLTFCTNKMPPPSPSRCPLTRATVPLNKSGEVRNKEVWIKIQCKFCVSV